MQFTTPLAILLAATGISALPTVEVQKRLDAIPLSIFTGLGCNDAASPTPVSTFNIPTDGSCYGVSPTISGNTDSGIILSTNLAKLPAGCSVVAYFDTECTSVNTLPFNTVDRCGTFGPGKLIRSAKTVGTCA